MGTQLIVLLFPLFLFPWIEAEAAGTTTVTSSESERSVSLTHHTRSVSSFTSVSGPSETESSVDTKSSTLGSPTASVGSLTRNSRTSTQSHSETVSPIPTMTGTSTKTFPTASGTITPAATPTNTQTSSLASGTDSSTVEPTRTFTNTLTDVTSKSLTSSRVTLTGDSQSASPGSRSASMRSLSHSMETYSGLTSSMQSNTETFPSSSSSKPSVSNAGFSVTAPTLSASKRTGSRATDSLLTTSLTKPSDSIHSPSGSAPSRSFPEFSHSLNSLSKTENSISRSQVSMTRGSGTNSFTSSEPSQSSLNDLTQTLRTRSKSIMTSSLSESPRTESEPTVSSSTDLSRSGSKPTNTGTTTISPARTSTISLSKRTDSGTGRSLTRGTHSKTFPTVSKLSQSMSSSKTFPTHTDPTLSLRTESTSKTPSVRSESRATASSTVSAKSRTKGTSSLSLSETITPADTVTASFSQTPSHTISLSPTVSIKTHSGQTRTSSPSLSRSLSPTITPAPTDTSTFTFTGSLSTSQTLSPTISPAPTTTMTLSHTPSLTSTNTLTATVSPPPTTTLSLSHTRSLTNTLTVTPPPTRTPSLSLSTTLTLTRSPSSTLPLTSTKTISETLTTSPSWTLTPSSTISSTLSESATISQSQSESISQHLPRRLKLFRPLYPEDQVPSVANPRRTELAHVEGKPVISVDNSEGISAQDLTRQGNGTVLYVSLENDNWILGGGDQSLYQESAFTGCSPRCVAQHWSAFHQFPAPQILTCNRSMMMIKIHYQGRDKLYPEKDVEKYLYNLIFINCTLQADVPGSDPLNFFKTSQLVRNYWLLEQEKQLITTVYSSGGSQSSKRQGEVDEGTNTPSSFDQTSVYLLATLPTPTDTMIDHPQRFISRLLVIRNDIVRPPLEIGPRVLSATENTVAVIGIASAFSSPALAAQAGRFRLISSLATCGQFPDQETSLEVFESPTQAKFGPDVVPRSKPFIGAVVMNSVLLLCFILLHFGAGLVYKKLEQARREAKHGSAMFKSKEEYFEEVLRGDGLGEKRTADRDAEGRLVLPVLTTDAGGSSGRKKKNQIVPDDTIEERKPVGLLFALSRVRFPSLHVGVIFILLQPTIALSLKAFWELGTVSGSDKNGAHFGYVLLTVLALLSWVALLVFMIVTLAKRARSKAKRHLASVKWREEHLKKQPMTLAIFLNGLGDWVELKQGGKFVAQFGFWFVDYRNETLWFLCVEIAVSALAGIISGIEAHDDFTCKGIAGTVCALFGLYLILYLAIRPHAALFNTLTYGICALGQFIGALFLTLYRTEGLEDLQPPGIVILLVVTFIMVVKGLIDLTLEIYFLLRNKKDTKKVKSAIEDGHQSRSVVIKGTLQASSPKRLEGEGVARFEENIDSEAFWDPEAAEASKGTETAASSSVVKKSQKQLELEQELMLFRETSITYVQPPNLPLLQPRSVSAVGGATHTSSSPNAKKRRMKLTHGTTRGSLGRPTEIDEYSDEEDKQMEMELFDAGQPNAQDVAISALLVNDSPKESRNKKDRSSPIANEAGKAAFETAWMTERLPRPTKRSKQEDQQLYDLL